MNDELFAVLFRGRLDS